MASLTTAEIVSIFSMLVALTAVIVGPVVTLKVAKRQIVSPIRQKWIDELRELMSEYLSECRKLVILNGGEGLLAAGKTDEALFKKLLYLEQKLRLMLNPREADHTRLVEMVEDINEAVHHGVGNIIEFGGELDGATTQCQKILKNEWERVKGAI